MKNMIGVTGALSAIFSLLALSLFDSVCIHLLETNIYNYKTENKTFHAGRFSSLMDVL